MFEKEKEFLCNPKNIGNCADCPMNEGQSEWPGNRPPCGQFHCWVEVHCAESGEHTYYMILRPVGIGSQPKGFVAYRNYSKRKYIPEITHEAWGEVTYKRQLSEKELHDYDMKEKIPYQA